jgi:hypothetical protein
VRVHVGSVLRPGPDAPRAAKSVDDAWNRLQPVDNTSMRSGLWTTPSWKSGLSDPQPRRASKCNLILARSNRLV